jgi:BirA family biotin operon repressor/biotin-[acetyl-CoA-carboxylase] ligase
MPDPASTPYPELDPVLVDLNAAAERIWLDSHEACPTLSIEVRPELGSTNTELMQRGRQGEVSPALLTAVRQTAGRGRQGRIWTAEPGATLTFSLGMPLNLDAIPGGGSALSLAVGLAAAQALDQGLSQWQAHHTQTASTAPPHPAIGSVGLKWPNDLYLQGRKLGGILIEATPTTGLPPEQRWVVIGLGINVLSAPEGAASLVEQLEPLALPAPSVGDVWRWIAPALIRAVQHFEAQGFAPIQTQYAARDVLLDQAVGLWTRPGQSPADGVAPSESGQALGVDAQGALQVQTPQGLRHWTTGEVSVRLQDA